MPSQLTYTYTQKINSDEFEMLVSLADEYITPERIRRYLQALSDTPAPSTAAALLRGSLLERLLAEDDLIDHPKLHFHRDFKHTGNTVLLTGAATTEKPLWYFAHLDTLSYLVQPNVNGYYPLVPFGYHLIKDGVRKAFAYRYSLRERAYSVVAKGYVSNVDNKPVFQSDDDAPELLPGDRIVLSVTYQENEHSGEFTGHIDNAGGVAALAVAAGVLAHANIDALLAFPDEEEGPASSGNQSMGRGSLRLVNLLPPPEIALVGDVQQAGGSEQADTHGGVENVIRLGEGAVLSEFSSLTRGAVTPPHLFALAKDYAEMIRAYGVRIQLSNNAYTSRSDDVSVLFRTPNILLLGFAGFNRHFDLGEPTANLHDLVDLAKSFVLFSLLRPSYSQLLSSAGRT